MIGGELATFDPTIAIAGTFTSPFRSLDPSEEKALEEKMEATNPDIVWVGLSTPKASTSAVSRAR